jgi:MFS family permease
VLALEQRGDGGLAVAAVLIAAAAPPVLLVRWTGRLVDRADSRLLLVGTGLVQAGVCVALAFASGVAEIIALVAVLAAGLAVTGPSLAALLPAMVRVDDLPRVTALGQTANSVGILMAPALGGVLAAVSLVNVAEVFFIRQGLHSTAAVFGLLSATWIGATIVGGQLLGRRRPSDAGLGVTLLGALALACLAVAAGLFGLGMTAVFALPLLRAASRDRHRNPESDRDPEHDREPGHGAGRRAPVSAGGWPAQPRRPGRRP